MKTKVAGVILGAFLMAVFAGCQGIKASTDNATLTKGPHYDSAGKLREGPEVSVPLWSSEKLKKKPKDISPAKESEK